MTVDELINSIGLPEGELRDNVYTITLEDSDDYSRAYTKLSNADIVNLDIDNIKLSEHETVMTYLADDYDIVLTANFDDDYYTIELREL